MKTIDDLQTADWCGAGLHQFGWGFRDGDQGFRFLHRMRMQSWMAAFPVSCVVGGDDVAGLQRQQQQVGTGGEQESSSGRAAAVVLVDEDGGGIGDDEQWLAAAVAVIMLRQFTSVVRSSDVRLMVGVCVCVFARTSVPSRSWERSEARMIASTLFLLSSPLVRVFRSYPGACSHSALLCSLDSPCRNMLFLTATRLLSFCTLLSLPNSTHVLQRARECAKTTDCLSPSSSLLPPE